MMPYNNPFSNIPNLLSSFSRFKQNFQGDPRMKVQEHQNSGQMTPQQFEELQVMARQFQNLLK